METGGGRTETLPPRARLLHVGLMKTGTTALQSAASRRREVLLQYGVRYPGMHYNHRREAQALSRRAPATERKRLDYWDRLMAEVEADPVRRILISNEMIAGGDMDVIRQLREDLGPRAHVVFTVRSFTSVLPSLWQQYVKSGHRHSFAEFLTARLSDNRVPPADMERHDQAALVQRWVEVFGAHNVTVIVADRSEPSRVPSSFEALLGLPAGTLYEPELSGESLNRSLSVHEASLLLEVNRLLAPYDVSKFDFDRLLFKGATARMLDHCRSDPDAQLVLPPWAIPLAVDRSRNYAEAIAGTGVRVIGDLEDLGKTPQVGRGQYEASSVIPVDVAAQAVLGVLSAALRRGSDFEPPTSTGQRPWAASCYKRLIPSVVRRRLSRLRSQLRSRRG